MRDRWQRDCGIIDIIDYYDQPEHSSLDLLQPSEMKLLYEEMEKCAASFEYTARNYFWIVDKDFQDIPFRLWESQELILDKLYHLKARARAQRLIILKARQLGCSTLIEALIAWRAMFYPNTNGLVLSYTPGHATELFSIMLHIYDMMPWWLKPMIYTRKYDEGLHFTNPKEDLRRTNPGVNSKVVVNSANQFGGVGQGWRLNCAHLSEFADWDQEKAENIIAGDLRWALVDSPETIAILESTAKGAGRYAEDLWEASCDLGDIASWTPLFLGWFFEKKRFIPPEGGWKPDKREIGMRDRVKDEWVKCGECGQLREATFRGESTTGLTCSECNKGTLEPLLLSDGQLRWMWEQRVNAERQSETAIKQLRQELASNPQEAFQIFGYQVFPQPTMDWVAQWVRKNPYAVGNLDPNGLFHGLRHLDNPEDKSCWQKDCQHNHEFDDQPLRIWEMPIPGQKYAIGVDVAGGIGGDGDFSVVWINKLGRPPMPDVHVATYRSNTINAYFLADVVHWLGRWYNTAQVAVEYNNYQTTADRVRLYHKYPNLFRWKHHDAEKILSTKWHWVTRVNTKPALWQTAISWLGSKAWIIRDPVFAHEMKHFNKEFADSTQAGAQGNKHDDVVMAAMIALYTAHDLDGSASGKPIPVPYDQGFAQNLDWMMGCAKCDFKWEAMTATADKRCARCGSIMLHGHRKTAQERKETFEFEELLQGATLVERPGLEYH